LQRLKNINLKIPARASLWYLGTNAVAKAVGFIITPFFTRMISGQAYGELTLYLTLLGIASVGCSAVNTGSAMYKGIKDRDKDKWGFLKSSLLVSILFSLAFCLLLFAFRPFFKLKPHLYIPLSLQIICDGIIAVHLSHEKFCYHYKEVTLITVLNSIIPPIATLLLLRLVNGRFRVRIYLLLAISLFLAIYSLCKILCKKGKLTKEVTKAHLKTSIPLLPHTISNALSGQADKLIITAYLGASSLAKYAVIHSLGVGLQFAVGAIGFALGPWIIRRLKKMEYKEVSAITGVLLSVFSALSLCLIALAPEAMKILAPREYLDAFPALLPIALSTPLVLLSSVTTTCLIHFGKGKENALLSVVSAILGLILNFSLIKKLGYLGAGLAILLSQLFYSIMGLALVFKTDLGDELSLITLAKNILLTSSVGLLLFFLFEFPALRVLALILPAIILLRNFYSLKGKIVE
jgi:O-antigen/teichoic acid export membrane protein